MEFTLAIVIGILFSTGFYMLLRRSMIKLIIGIILISHAANLLVFTTGHIVRGNPPVIPPDLHKLVEPFSDPLPQALVLTAIVIGFGVQAFVLVLFKRAYSLLKTDDLDNMKSTDTLKEEDIIK